jgi:hypothetical protein
VILSIGWLYLDKRLYPTSSSSAYFLSRLHLPSSFLFTSRIFFLLKAFSTFPLPSSTISLPYLIQPLSPSPRPQSPTPANLFTSRNPPPLSKVRPPDKMVNWQDPQAYLRLVAAIYAGNPNIKVCTSLIFPYIPLKGPPKSKHTTNNFEPPTRST